MIARFRILLPFSIFVRAGDEFPIADIDYGIYRVRIHPPCKAALDPADIRPTSPVPLDDVLRQLKPSATPEMCDLVNLNGNRTIEANLLQVDFVKPEFDRRRSKEGPRPDDECDPPHRLGFAIANNWLQRLRTVSRAGQICILTPTSTFWEMEYLADDESPLPQDPELFRRHAAASTQWKLVGLNRECWDRVNALPHDYEPYGWDRIILDAEALLPDIAASLSLANAALEAFSSWWVNQLATLRGMPSGMWDWINERGDWYKEPSVDERFDVLSRILAGKSLKQETELWKAYKELRGARNKFAHGGKVLIGKTEVSLELAGKLVLRAMDIITWCETLLPATIRRPPIGPEVQWEIRKIWIGLKEINADSGAV